MSDINIKFLHPIDGREISVTLDDTMTGREAIAELIAGELIVADPAGYSLALKGGNILDADISFKDLGLKDNAILNILPATDAGFILKLK